MHALPDSLYSLSDALRGNTVESATDERLFSIWEITSWILPMAPEHFRRVLAANPDIPQGVAGSEGGTRWFTARDLVPLRAHFSQGPRGGRYQPHRPKTAQAPIVTFAGPAGDTGRSTALVHLASAASLSGWRVLVIDADPSGRLAELLCRSVAPDVDPPPLSGPLAVIGRSAALHMRRMNATRLDLGEPPLPMDERLSSTLAVTVKELLRPSIWPGLDVLAAPTGAGLLADPLISAWRMTQRSWQPWRVLAEALDEEGLRQNYDLILCDTGRGLGPMALSALISADVMLIPVPLSGSASAPGPGLAALAAAISRTQAEAQDLAQALGQPGLIYGWRRVGVLPTRAGPQGIERLAAVAAKLGGVPGDGSGIELLPVALPEVAEIASGRADQFYDIDYRQLGRLAYAPQREAFEAAFKALAGLVSGLWHEDSTRQPSFL